MVGLSNERDKSPLWSNVWGSFFVCDQQPLSPPKKTGDIVRVVLPFKDQVSADTVKKQLKDLSLKVQTTVQPVFVSRKIVQELKVQETKPLIVNQQCVFYRFQCDLCDGGYVGYTRGHLHEGVEGHKHQSSSISKHCNQIIACTGRSLKTY